MSQTSPLSPLPETMPPRYYRWYVTFWHVVYLGVLALFSGQIVERAVRAGLSWQTVVLGGSVLLQAGLYVRLVVFGRSWPLPTKHLALYFGGSLLLWLVEWRLEPGFYWLIMSYLGQTYGLLPPVFAVPASIVLLGFVSGQSIGWQITRVNGWALFGGFMGWLSFTILFVFVYYLGQTNVQHAKLILKLQAAQKELETARQHDAELAALRERERLARDLHDSLGHALVALSVQLEAIQRLYKVDPERASAQVEELKTLTRAHMDELRRALTGLRAPGLGERLLSQALQALSAETGKRAAWELACHIDERADALSPAVAETVWRVAQEALTNIEKHAAARSVQLRLELQPHSVALTVSDDGCGLPADAETRPGHYGLRGMRERVEGLGGTLTVNGNGKGTLVQARLPIL